MRFDTLLTAFLVTLLLLTASMCSAAQTSALTLQNCIDIALENQTDLKVAKNQVSIAEQQATIAKSQYYPRVSVQNNTFRVGSEGLLTKSYTGTALTVTQNFWDGGLREANVRSAKYGITQRNANLERTGQAVIYDVTQSYYEVLRSKRLLEVAETSVKYNESMKKLIETRVELGDAAQVDALPVEAQLASARVSMVSAQNAVQMSAIRLQSEMGLTPRADFDVKEVDSTPNIELLPLETYLADAIAARPDIVAAQASVGSAKADVRASKISLYPKPTISGEYQTGIAGLSGTSTQITGGISFDIFNGKRNRASYDAARVNEVIAELRSEQTVRDIQAQVQSAYLNLANAKERLEASNIGLQAAQNNYDAQSARYKLGLAITLDLLNAELQVVTAKTNEVQARYDYFIAIAQMEYAMGKYGGISGS